MSEFTRIQQENSQLTREMQNLRSQVASLRTNGFGKEEELLLQMRSRLTELQSRHSVIDQDTDRLVKKSQRNSLSSKNHVQIVVEHPEVQKYRMELTSLISENRSLVTQVKRMETTLVL